MFALMDDEGADWVDPGTCLRSLVKGRVLLWSIPGVFLMEGLSAFGSKRKLAPEIALGSCGFCGTAALAEKNPGAPVPVGISKGGLSRILSLISDGCLAGEA